MLTSLTSFIEILLLMNWRITMQFWDQKSVHKYQKSVDKCYTETILAIALPCFPTVILLFATVNNSGGLRKNLWQLATARSFAS